jgi:hypothetical protein
VRISRTCCSRAAPVADTNWRCAKRSAQATDASSDNC